MHGVLTPMLPCNAWHAHSSDATKCQRNDVSAAAAAAAAADDDDDDGGGDDDDGGGDGGGGGGGNDDVDDDDDGSDDDNNNDDNYKEDFFSVHLPLKVGTPSASHKYLGPTRCAYDVLTEHQHKLSNQ